MTEELNSKLVISANPGVIQLSRLNAIVIGIAKALHIVLKKAISNRVEFPKLTDSMVESAGKLIIVGAGIWFLGFLSSVEGMR